MSVEQVTEAELNAFVDGQLDLEGRLEVQDYLSRNPDLAARVMADLGLRESLKLALPLPAGPAPLRTQTAARLLSEGLRSRRYAPSLRQLAAGIALFALGWGASTGWDHVRSKGERQTAATTIAEQNLTAAQNRFTSMQGPRQASGIIDASHLDPAKLGTAVSVKLPRIPDGWKVIGTRVLDSREGAGVEVMFQTPDFGRLSLFARHTQDVAIVLPTFAKVKGEPTAHWQLVSDTYELTGPLPRQPLEFAALELFQTLY